MHFSFDRIRTFYAEYLPVGDRLGEMFYAVWMVIVSLGILDTLDPNENAVFYVIIIALGVNMTWGLIDGITVMHTNVMEKAKREEIVYNIRKIKDDDSKKAAMDALDDSITTVLNDDDRRKILEMISVGDPGEDPAKKRYYPTREDWNYAIGIFAIDTALVFPLVSPLIILHNPYQALYFSRLISTVIFMAIGAAYAGNLHRRKWVAALFLGTLCFSLFSLNFFY